MALFEMEDLKSFLKYCFWGMVMWYGFGFFLLCLTVNSILAKVTADGMGFIRAALLFNILAGIILGGLVYISMVISGSIGWEFFIFLLPLSMGSFVGFIETTRIYPYIAHRFDIAMEIPFYYGILGIICGMIPVPAIIKYARRFHDSDLY